MYLNIGYVLYLYIIFWWIKIHLKYILYIYSPQMTDF